MKKEFGLPDFLRLMAVVSALTIIGGAPGVFLELLVPIRGYPRFWVHAITFTIAILGVPVANGRGWLPEADVPPKLHATGLSAVCVILWLFLEGLVFSRLWYDVLRYRSADAVPAQAGSPAGTALVFGALLILGIVLLAREEMKQRNSPERYLRRIAEAEGHLARIRGGNVTAQPGVTP